MSTVFQLDIPEASLEQMAALTRTRINNWRSRKQGREMMNSSQENVSFRWFVQMRRPGTKGRRNSYASNLISGRGIRELCRILVTHQLTIPP